MDVLVTGATGGAGGADAVRCRAVPGRAGLTLAARPRPAGSVRAEAPSLAPQGHLLGCVPGPFDAAVLASPGPRMAERAASAAGA
jgi:hypothetical protein